MADARNGAAEHLRPRTLLPATRCWLQGSVHQHHLTLAHRQSGHRTRKCCHSCWRRSTCRPQTGSYGPRTSFTPCIRILLTWSLHCHPPMCDASRGGVWPALRWSLEPPRPNGRPDRSPPLPVNPALRYAARFPRAPAAPPPLPTASPRPPGRPSPRPRPRWPSRPPACYSDIHDSPRPGRGRLG